MEKTTTSKKALRGLINDSMQEALGNLELPKPSKKVKKLMHRSARKIASIYADILKREDKKKKKGFANVLLTLHISQQKCSG